MSFNLEIKRELSSLKDFKAWSGGAEVLETLNDEEVNYLENYLQEVCTNGIDETGLNDFLWFEACDILEEAGLRNED